MSVRPNTQPTKKPNRNGDSLRCNGIRWPIKPPQCWTTLRGPTSGSSAIRTFILKTEQYWAAIQSLVDPSTFRWSRVSRSHLTPGEHHERPAWTKCDGQMMFTGMVAGPLGFNQPPHLPGLPAPEQSWRHRLFTERQPNQICRVSGAEFPHQPRTMTFERPRTDVHPHRTLLVGASLADMPQNFPLPRG